MIIHNANSEGTIFIDTAYANQEIPINFNKWVVPSPRTLINDKLTIALRFLFWTSREGTGTFIDSHKNVWVLNDFYQTDKVPDEVFVNSCYAFEINEIIKMEESLDRPYEFFHPFDWELLAALGKVEFDAD